MLPISKFSSTKLNDLIKYGQELKKFPFHLSTEKRKIDRYGNDYSLYKSSSAVRIFPSQKLRIRNVYSFKGYGGALKAWVDRIELHFKKRYGEFSPESQKARSILNKKGFQLFLFRANSEVVPLSGLISSRKLALRQQKQLEGWRNEFVDEYFKLLNKITPSASQLKINLDASEKVANIVFSEKRLTAEVKNKLVGNIVCQSIAGSLRRIAKKAGFSVKEKMDDIQALSQILKDQKKDKRLQRFFVDNYKSLSLADQVRNKSCHVYEKAPSRHQISLCIELLRKLGSL